MHKVFGFFLCIKYGAGDRIAVHKNLIASRGAQQFFNLNTILLDVVRNLLLGDRTVALQLEPIFQPSRINLFLFHTLRLAQDIQPLIWLCLIDLGAFRCAF